MQTIRLHYQLDPDEFITYDVEDDNRLIIFSKDFLPLLEIAEVSESDIQINFTHSSDPVFVNVTLDQSVALQVMMSSMREDFLKDRTNPPAQTSYKEVMDSYIQQVQSGKKAVTESPPKSISDTEMKRIVDPSVGSFGTSGRSSQKVVTAESSARSKRKSTEMSEVSTNNAFAHSSDVSFKKPKPNQQLSQKEQEEVSQLVMDLESMDYDEDEDFECLAQPKPLSLLKPSISVSKILDGLKPMNRRQTVTKSRSQSSSVCESETSQSVRLDVSMAKFNSEKEVSDEIEGEVSDRIEREAPPARPKETEIMRKLYYTKKCFKGFLNAEQDSELPAILSKGANSDSDD